MKPFCFILMPFGTKTDGNNKEINFDVVYQAFIKPAIEAAGLEPVRADEEQGGGFIHKPMYERLLFCDFAIADLSFANANVFYELGIRHTAKPYTTVSVFEMNTKLPFDVAPLRALPYEFKDGVVADVEQKIKQLTDLIKINLNAQKAQEDSPVGQMITGYPFPDLSGLQKSADTFRDQVNQTNDLKEKLNELVRDWKQLDKESKSPTLTDADQQRIRDSKAAVLEKVKEYQTVVGTELNYNYDLIYALLNAYKSMSAFGEAESLLSDVLKAIGGENVYLKQQLALALNKQGKREAAEEVLTAIINKYGPDPETNGLLGSVYKGLMDENKEDEIMRPQYQQQAIATYLAGFEADPRDYYPGVNALTLIYFDRPDDERFKKFFPLVSYAVERQLTAKKNDYWVQATALELAALELNEAKARQYLGAALATNPAKWEKETTANNLKKIYEKAVERNNEDSLKWLQDIIGKLLPSTAPIP